MTDNIEKNPELETHSFILLGKTGAGKSSLSNNIAKEQLFKVGDSFSSCTTETSAQTIFDKKNNCYLFTIDTPGFEDSEGRDNDNIEKMKNFIKENERIKCIVIVIPFTLTRCDKSLQNSIKIIAELFPLDKFWEHVIIVWSHYEPNKTKQKEKIEKDFIKSLDGLFNDLEKNQKISKPNDLKMKFIDSDPDLVGEEKLNSERAAEELVKDIIDMKPMYKQIVDGEEEDIEDEPKGGTQQGDDTVYNYKKRKIRTFTDFDDKKIEKEYIIEKYKVTKKKCQGNETPISLSSEETNNRNELIRREKNKFKDEEDYKRTKRENPKKMVKYKKYEYYKNNENNPFKTEETRDIDEEWIEEKVTETEAIPSGYKINYNVYEFLEKRTNKYQNPQIIGEKKKIQTYYEEEIEGKDEEGPGFDNYTKNGYKIFRYYKQFKSTRTGQLIADKKYYKMQRIEHYWENGPWEKENSSNYKRKNELKEKVEEDGITTSIKTIEVKWEPANITIERPKEDWLDYREDGYEEEEYTEYYNIMSKTIYKLGDVIMEESNWEKVGSYKKTAKLYKTRTSKERIGKDLKEIFKKKLEIYDEKTKKRKTINLPNEENINYYYFTIYDDEKKETKEIYEDSGEKDKDGERIYKKHYITKIYKKTIIKGKNNEDESDNDWHFDHEEKRKNIRCEMRYRRGEYTGNYSYKWFAWAKWDHKYEYKFYKTLVRYYDDGKTEEAPEVYRGAWYI